MPSLYIDRKGVELKLNAGALVFYENNERVGTVPLAPIDRVYLKGDIKLQVSLLSKLGEMGIGIISLSGRKNTASTFLPSPHNDAYRRLSQYHIARDEIFCVLFARKVVLLKIITAIDWLQKAVEHRADKKDMLEKKITEFRYICSQVNNQKNLSSLRGLEGRAGAIYFSTLSDYLPKSLNFNGRNRRPPRDPFNALMSLTYTILHGDAILEIYGGGLDPYIGFYHSLDFSRESLACDLIEPLRPLVDNWLISLFRSKEIRVEHFSITESGCVLGKTGRVNFYKAYEQQIKVWRKMLRQNVSDLVHLLTESNILELPQRKYHSIESQNNYDYMKYKDLLENYYFNQYSMVSEYEFYY